MANLFLKERNVEVFYTDEDEVFEAYGKRFSVRDLPNYPTEDNVTSNGTRIRVQSPVSYEEMADIIREAIDASVLRPYGIVIKSR